MARKKKPKRAYNGEGSFRYKDNGKVECRISYKDACGRSKRRSFTGDDEQDVLEKIEKFKVDLEKINDGINVEATIADLIEERCYAQR